jgi:glutathione S-transferase
MAMLLYELAGADDRRFSPYCWRTRMALAHKDIACDSRGVAFTAIPAILDGSRKTVPVLDDHGTVVSDSTVIADHLDRAYPERPKLFRSAAERGLATFMNEWVAGTVHGGLIGFVVLDIHDCLAPPDQAYFRASREKRFGRSLEEVQQGREERVEGFRKSLAPLRQTVSAQAFLGGAAPCYADYIVFGAFQWVRVVSSFRPLADDDPVLAWFRRCLDLYGGVARVPGGWS